MPSFLNFANRQAYFYINSANLLCWNVHDNVEARQSALCINIRNVDSNWSNYSLIRPWVHFNSSFVWISDNTINRTVLITRFNRIAIGWKSTWNRWHEGTTVYSYIKASFLQCFIVYLQYSIRTIVGNRWPAKPIP
jgi:hypothetical protein